MISFFKKRSIYLFSILILSLIFLFLNPNRLLGFLSFLLSFFLSFFLLYRFDKKRENDKKKAAIYSFFSSLLNSLLLGKSGKTSYDFACQFLTGYQEIIPYETILKNPSNLNLLDYQDYFNFIIQKENKNEAHLPDYVPLIDQVETKLKVFQESEKKEKKGIQLVLSSLILIFLLFLILISTNPTLSNALKSAGFTLYSAFVLPLLFPSYLYFLGNHKRSYEE